MGSVLVLLDEIINENSKFSVESLGLSTKENAVFQIQNIKISSLTDIEGLQETKPQSLILTNLPIKNFKGTPKSTKIVHAHNCRKLKSCEGLSPNVHKLTIGLHTPITNLKGLTNNDEYEELIINNGIFERWTGHTIKKAEFIEINSAKLESLNYCVPDVTSLMLYDCVHINLSNCWKPFKRVYELSFHFTSDNLNPTPVLGLMRIPQLKLFSPAPGDPVLKIISKYIPLKSMSNIMHCKQELINAGFKDYAAF